MATFEGRWPLFPAIRPLFTHDGIGISPSITELLFLPKICTVQAWLAALVSKKCVTNFFAWNRARTTAMDVRLQTVGEYQRNSLPYIIREQWWKTLSSTAVFCPWLISFLGFCVPCHCERALLSDLTCSITTQNEDNVCRSDGIIHLRLFLALLFISLGLGEIKSVYQHAEWWIQGDAESQMSSLGASFRGHQQSSRWHAWLELRLGQDQSYSW